jgi:uncharacterized protein
MVTTVSMEAINTFFKDRKLALFGATNIKSEFGNTAYRELKERGFTVYPVNSRLTTVGGDHCYPDLKSLPEDKRISRILITSLPSVTDQIVRDAISLGFEHIWIQLGSETPGAIKLLTDEGINVIYGQCILMFAEPVTSYHLLRRYWWTILRKTPVSIENSLR